MTSNLRSQYLRSLASGCMGDGEISVSGRLYDNQVCVCVCVCVSLRCSRLETEDEGTPMWFTSEPSSLMSSFKSKISRRKYALAHGGGSSGSRPPPDLTDDNAGGLHLKGE